jgi:C4-dicarboxylate transporter DctM subunit
MIVAIAIVATFMLVAGFEMFLVLGVPSYLIKVVYFGSLPDTLLIQKMVGGINHNVLLAIPFFMFAAELMSSGRLSTLLGNAAQAMFRRVRGGPGYATIAGCMAMGAVSGSAPATVAALGRIMDVPMRRAGYSDRYSVGLIVSAAETALLIPPSISLIIYGWLTETSISRLFAAGLVIGILLAFAFAVLTFFEIRRTGTKARIHDDDESGQVIKGTIWALGMPVVILGGIYSGLFTATEAAAISVVYALLVEAFVFRSMTLNKFMQIAQRTAVMTSIIFILLATGSMIAYFVVIAQLPQAVIAMLAAVGANSVLFLLAVNIVFFVAGMFIDPGTAQLILVPVLFPVAVSYGIDPVHFGMVVGLNVCLAMITPPFGLDLFVASSTLDRPVVEIIRGVTPFVIVNIVVLLIVTYVPGVATFLPNLLMGSS